MTNFPDRATRMVNRYEQYDLDRLADDLLYALRTDNNSLSWTLIEFIAQECERTGKTPSQLKEDPQLALVLYQFVGIEPPEDGEYYLHPQEEYGS